MFSVAKSVSHSTAAYNAAREIQLQVNEPCMVEAATLTDVLISEEVCH